MTNARETCTKPDLLPCPFCGSANIDPEEWRSGDGHGPGCSDCGACADTLERWNSRPVNREDGVAALGALLVHLPENWGDCIRDGEMRLTVDENAIESALEALRPVAEGNPNLRRTVVMSYELALHLLRNPYGHSDDVVRQARLWAADRIEAASRHQSGQQRIRIETTVGGHLAVTLLPSGASALFRSTGEIGETIAHSLPNRFEAPIGECHQVSNEGLRAAAEHMVQTFRDWMAGCNNETRWKEVQAAHINLRDTLTKLHVACNKQEGA